jgi:hypothetical protein
MTSPPPVAGSIDSLDGNIFTAVFSIGGVNFTGTGTFEPDVQPFEAPDAILTYPSIKDLSGSIPFIGLVGLSEITLTIGPNPDGTHTTIKGQIIPPISQANRVAGEITWKGN